MALQMLPEDTYATFPCGRQNEVEHQNQCYSTFSVKSEMNDERTFQNKTSLDSKVKTCVRIKSFVTMSYNPLPPNFAKLSQMLSTIGDPHDLIQMPKKQQRHDKKSQIVDEYEAQMVQEVHRIHTIRSINNRDETFIELKSKSTTYSNISVIHRRHNIFHHMDGFLIGFYGENQQLPKCAQAKGPTRPTMDFIFV